MAQTAEVVEQQVRVLVTDDDVDICALIAGVFRRTGRVTIAHDAEHALSIMSQEEPFDVIISDYKLPGASGLDFIARVRAEPTWSKTPIVMISGSSGPMKTRALTAGADAFLSKPFTLDQLRTVVIKALQRTKFSA